jgi:hypothetical protein
MEETDSKTHKTSESSKFVHQHETAWQIYLPFSLGIVFICVIVFIFVLPNEVVWRTRAGVVADWLYSALCLFPLIICSFLLYLIFLFGIYGLSKLHTGTEDPLLKLELASANFAERINIATNYINEKTIAFNTATAPLDDLLSTFDTAMPSDEEEMKPDDGTK